MRHCDGLQKHHFGRLLTLVRQRLGERLYTKRFKVRMDHSRVTGGVMYHDTIGVYVFEHLADAGIWNG